MESIGAWSKIREIENNKRKKHFTNSGVTPMYVHVPDARTYCVVIAVKGRILYPRSKEVKSFSQVIRCNFRLFDDFLSLLLQVDGINAVKKLSENGPQSFREIAILITTTAQQLLESSTIYSDRNKWKLQQMNDT